MTHERESNPISSSARKSTVWHIDSGATSHMTFDRSAFVTYSPITPFRVQMGDRSSSLAVARGDVHLCIKSNGKTSICELRDVLHVPSFVYSRISVTSLAKRGLVVQFHSDFAKILRGGNLVASGTRVGGLYTLDLSSSSKHQETALAVASLQRWHERLGHVHQAGVLEMARKKRCFKHDYTPWKTRRSSL